MATQRYMPRGETTPPGQAQNDLDHPVHGAQRRTELGLNSANPTAGPVKSPAPVKPYDPTARDRTFGRDSGNPGSNAWSGASSLSPGETTVDVAAAKQPQPDQTLDLIKSKSQAMIEHDGSGVDRMLTNSQMRDVSSENVPVAHGMHSPNKIGETVPGVDPSRNVQQERSAPVRQVPVGPSSALNLNGKSK